MDASGVLLIAAGWAAAAAPAGCAPPLNWRFMAVCPAAHRLRPSSMAVIASATCEGVCAVVLGADLNLHMRLRQKLTYFASCGAHMHAVAVA